MRVLLTMTRLSFVAKNLLKDQASGAWAVSRRKKPEAQEGICH